MGKKKRLPPKIVERFSLNVSWVKVFPGDSIPCLLPRSFQGMRVIEITGMHPDPVRIPTPCLLQGMGQ